MIVKNAFVYPAPRFPPLASYYIAMVDSPKLRNLFIVGIVVN